MRVGEAVAGELTSADQRVAAACAAAAGLFGEGWLMLVGQPRSLLGIALIAVLAVPGWYLSTLVWRLVLRLRGREPSEAETWVFASPFGMARAHLVVLVLRGLLLLARALICAVLVLPATVACLVVAVQPWRWGWRRPS